MTINYIGHDQARTIKIIHQIIIEKNSSDIINKITIFCLASKLVFTIELGNTYFSQKVTTTVSDIIWHSIWHIR